MKSGLKRSRMNNNNNNNNQYQHQYYINTNFRQNPFKIQNSEDTNLKLNICTR